MYIFLVFAQFSIIAASVLHQFIMCDGWKLYKLLGKMEINKMHIL